MGVHQAPETCLKKVVFDEVQLLGFTDRDLFAVLVNHVGPILPDCQIDVAQFALFQGGYDKFFNLFEGQLCADRRWLTLVEIVHSGQD